jgi:hypothetical protein
MPAAVAYTSILDFELSARDKPDDPVGNTLRIVQRPG